MNLASTRFAAITVRRSHPQRFITAPGNARTMAGAHFAKHTQRRMGHGREARSACPRHSIHRLSRESIYRLSAGAPHNVLRDAEAANP